MVDFYTDYLEMPELKRLKHDKKALEWQIEHECLGDMERYPLKRELERINKRIAEIR